MREGKLFFMVLFDIMVQFSKLLNSLLASLSPHIPFKIPVLIFIFLEFSFSVLWKNPRKYRELVEIIVSPATGDVEAHQVVKIWDLVIEPLFSDFHFIPRFNQVVVLGNYFLNRRDFGALRLGDVLVEFFKESLEFSLMTTIKRKEESLSCFENYFYWVRLK